MDDVKLKRTEWAPVVGEAKAAGLKKKDDDDDDDMF